MKQTAVEWLENQLRKKHTLTTDDIKDIEEAKVMEQKQIERAYKMGRYESDMIVMSDKFYAKQYYNETFKSE